MRQIIANGDPDPRYPGQTRVMLGLSTTRQPVHHIEDSEGTDVPRSVTDSTEQWVWCFMHMRFMLYVISVICLVRALLRQQW